MNKIILSIILSVIASVCFAQKDFKDVEYQGGNEALMQMIYGNLRYPEECMKQDVQGVVIAKIQVHKDGSIGKVEILESPHTLMSNEVLRIVKLFPKFIPARKNGKNVEGEITLPVSFMLSSNAPEVSTSVQCAEKAETIESFISRNHKPEWYAQQALAWQKIVDGNPQDQWAWRNLFRATYYSDQFNNGWGESHDESKTADIIKKMEETLPDSYVLNLCKARFCLSTDSAAMRGDNLYRAAELMPEDACAEDIQYLACRLWAINPECKLVGELLTKAYKKGYFPRRIMQYSWNILQSMEQDALFFCNGDVLTVPMKMQQEALGERMDVTIIPLSYLHVEEFREALFKRLGGKPLSLDVNDYGEYGYDWNKYYYTDVIMHIIRESNRPAYFSTDMLSWTNLDLNNLYNEGLVLKYSDKQYDNFAVAMNNVKNIYHLEYLTEPDLVYDSWETSAMLDANNVTLLANLVDRLREKGDRKEADRLYHILEKCLDRCNIDAGVKEQIADELKKQN